MKLIDQSLTRVAILLALLACAWRAGAEDFDAVLDWAGLHVVNFPLDGGITRVNVRPGDRVSKGAILVELNSEPIDIRISQYEAEVAAGKPVLADAKRDYQHAQSLYEQTVLSDVELQQAQHAYEKAMAELAASRARLEFAYWQKRQARIAAPFNAWVVQRSAEPGQMLVAEQRSRPLLVLARTGQMTARARLPLSVVRALNTGQAATVLVDNRPYPATLSSLGMQAETGSGDVAFPVEAVFQTGPTDAFRAGQAATLRLP